MSNCPICGLSNEGALGSRLPQCYCATITAMKKAENATLVERESIYIEVISAISNRALLAERRELLEWMEDWCGINAYDADRGPCDEHTVDDCRGVNCSAEELVTALKQKVGEK